MEKQRWEESGRRSQEVRRSEKRKSEKQEDAGARKGRKGAILYVFPMICGSGGSKSRLAKAAKCGAMWSDERWKVAHRCGVKHLSKSKGTKHLSLGALLGNAMLKKVHAAVAWSTCRSQNAKNTTWSCSDHSSTFRCRFTWHAKGIVPLVKSE